MTVEAAQREPTMEEILASIRRIISEEDGSAPKASEVLDLQSDADAEEEFEEAAFEEPAPVVAAPSPAPQPKAPPVDDLMVLDHEEEEPAPAPPPRSTSHDATPYFAPAPRVTVDPGHDGLVGERAANQAAGALGRLMGTMMVSSGATLDDVVRELLKPMLQEWLDANLPQIVENEVAKEIERIRRMARV